MTETWAQAMQRALYGPDGYYTAHGRGPGLDYRTSSTATPAFARAIARLIEQADSVMDGPWTYVEVAAASGLLLERVRSELTPTLLARVALHGVDLRPRPPGLHPSITWSSSVPPFGGLLFANEWLDNVPVDVVELAADGVRIVRTDGSLGELVDSRWQQLWWPLEQDGDRAELGGLRDALWAQAVGQLDRGLAVTVDYCTFLDDRAAGAYPLGTLTAYRDGRQCDPVPDGSCDLTAHLAVDAVAAAATADDTVITDQRRVLRSLGITGARPDRDATDVAALVAASEEGELLLPPLGAMTWLLQAKGCSVSSVMGWET